MPVLVNLSAAAKEELDVLASIYSDCCSLSGGTIAVSLDTSTHGSALLRFTLGPDYPTEPPCSVSVAVRDDAALAARVTSALQRLVHDSTPGDVVLFACIELARDILENSSAAQQPHDVVELRSCKKVERNNGTELQVPPRAAPCSCEYDTVACDATSILVEKKSRFAARAGHAACPADALAFIERHRDLSARHHCWAYCCGSDARSNDDGEPGGTAGAPILRAIELSRLDYIVVVVIRHFGGILLGSAGLTRAYGAVAAAALRTASRRRVTPMMQLTCSFELRDGGAARAVFAAAEKLCEAYDEQRDRYSFTVKVRADGERSLREALARATAGRARLDIIRLE
jgi:putative IMPACT (imprinted ancient) family translation regulator